MRISTGISEISSLISNSSGKISKTYLWPEYKQAKIEPIKAVKERVRREEFYYTKPDLAKKRELLEKSQSKERLTYSFNGKLKSSTNLDRQPGTFFDALA